MRLIHEQQILDLKDVASVSVFNRDWNTSIVAWSHGHAVDMQVKSGTSEHTFQQRNALAREIAVLMGTNDAYEITEDLKLRKVVSEDEDPAKLAERVARRDELVFQALAARDIGDHDTANKLLSQAQKALRGKV